MPLSNPTTIVSADAETLREALERELSGPLRSLVEFDRDAFNVLYVDDTTLSFYEDEDHLREHFDTIHSYVHLDLTEMDLFTDDLFPVADRVRYLATGFDVFTLVRVYVDRTGVFLALDPDEDVESAVSAVEAVLTDAPE